MHKTIPFSKIAISPKLVELITQGVGDGRLDHVARLQDELATLTHKQYVLATTSATSALHLAMCAMDIKRGDKVLCPVNSFANVPEVVRHFDAEPVFVDTLPGSYVIDPLKLIEAAARINSKKLRAVLVNHPAGEHAPMEEIRKIADRYNLKIVEDITERLGASDIGIYSDMAIVGFGTYGDNTIDGGALLTDNDELYNRAHLLRYHGIEHTSDDVADMYDVLDIGCPYKMSDFVGMYCRTLLQDHSHRERRQQEIASYYRARLSEAKNITLPIDTPDHQYAQFIIEIATNRDAFARKLKNAGIEVGVPYIPLNLTKYYKNKYKLKVFDFPVALDSYQKLMSLPIYAELTDDELGYICDAIIEIAKNHK